MRRHRILTAAILLIGLSAAGAGTFLWFLNDVETPAYRVVTRDADIEIRDYPSQVVAEVVRSGDRKSAVGAGFRNLASYIFAKEREGDRIAMTAPVTQEARRADKSWIVRFIMPATHTLETLPKPIRSEVNLRQLPAQRKAAIRFSGVATDQLIAEHEEMLRNWLERRNLKASGPVTYAYYNPPFTPGFLRRNEVLFDIADDQANAS